MFENTPANVYIYSWFWKKNIEIQGNRHSQWIEPIVVTACTLQHFFKQKMKNSTEKPVGIFTKTIFTSIKFFRDYFSFGGIYRRNQNIAIQRWRTARNESFTLARMVVVAQRRSESRLMNSFVLKIILRKFEWISFRVYQTKCWATGNIMLSNRISSK